VCPDAWPDDLQRSSGESTELKDKQTKHVTKLKPCETNLWDIIAVLLWFHMQYLCAKRKESHQHIASASNSFTSQDLDGYARKIQAIFLCVLNPASLNVFLILKRSMRNLMAHTHTHYGPKSWLAGDSECEASSWKLMMQQPAVNCSIRAVPQSLQNTLVLQNATAKMFHQGRKHDLEWFYINAFTESRVYTCKNGSNYPKTQTNSETAEENHRKPQKT